jgi:hypothetical protein
MTTFVASAAVCNLTLPDELWDIIAKTRFKTSISQMTDRMMWYTFKQQASHFCYEQLSYTTKDDWESNTYTVCQKHDDWPHYQTTVRGTNDGKRKLFKWSVDGEDVYLAWNIPSNTCVTVYPVGRAYRYEIKLVRYGIGFGYAVTLKYDLDSKQLRVQDQVFQNMRVYFFVDFTKPGLYGLPMQIIWVKQNTLNCKSLSTSTYLKRHVANLPGNGTSH